MFVRRIMQEEMYSRSPYSRSPATTSPVNLVLGALTDDNMTYNVPVAT